MATIDGEQNNFITEKSQTIDDIILITAKKNKQIEDCHDDDYDAYRECMADLPVLVLLLLLMMHCGERKRPREGVDMKCDLRRSSRVESVRCG